MILFKILVSKIYSKIFVFNPSCIIVLEIIPFNLWVVRITKFINKVSIKVCRIIFVLLLLLLRLFNNRHEITKIIRKFEFQMLHFYPLYKNFILKI